MKMTRERYYEHNPLSWDYLYRAFVPQVDLVYWWEKARRYAARVKGTEEEKIEDEEEVTYRYQYKWSWDPSLYLYPIWIVANNRMLKPSSDSIKGNNMLKDLVLLAEKDGVRKGLFRGFLPYLMVSMIYRGRVDIERDGESIYNIEKLNKQLIAYTINTFLIIWRIQLCLENPRMTMRQGSIPILLERAL